MAPHTEGGILSRIEFVLPKSVVQTAHNLSCGLGATFVSTNVAKKTSTQIKLFKRNDESVSINCTVCSLVEEQLSQPEHIMIDQVRLDHPPAETVSTPVLNHPPAETVSTPVNQHASSIRSANEPTVSCTETSVTPPQHQIPLSLLAHDDLTSPEKLAPKQSTTLKQPIQHSSLLPNDVASPEKSTSKQSVPTIPGRTSLLEYGDATSLKKLASKPMVQILTELPSLLGHGNMASPEKIALNPSTPVKQPTQRENSPERQTPLKEPAHKMLTRQNVSTSRSSQEQKSARRHLSGDGVKSKDSNKAPTARISVQANIEKSEFEKDFEKVGNESSEEKAGYSVVKENTKCKEGNEKMSIKDKTGQAEEKLGQTRSRQDENDGQIQGQNSEIRSLRSNKGHLGTAKISPVKTVLKNPVKTKQSKKMENISKSTEKVKNSENVFDLSPRRPRRATQLPARLAESEVFITRKRPASSEIEGSTPAKNIKAEAGSETGKEISGDNRKCTALVQEKEGGDGSKSPSALKGGEIDLKCAENVAGGLTSEKLRAETFNDVSKLATKNEKRVEGSLGNRDVTNCAQIGDVINSADSADVTNNTGNAIVIKPDGSGNVTENVTDVSNIENAGVSKSAENSDKINSAKSLEYMLPPEKTLPCPFCGQLMRQWENVFDHVKKYHANHSQYRQQLAELKEKMKTSCQICGRAISRPSAVRHHVETMHSETAQAKCDECGSVLKSQRHLDLHVKRCHRVTKRSHLCHLCPASFKIKAYLATHVQNVHAKTSVAETSCDQCGKTFSNERYMKTHKLRVHGPKKYSCPHCSMGFSEPPNLRRHVKLIHETPKQKQHFCPQCNKGFTLKSNLKGHIETVHLKKLQHQCNMCMEGFIRRRQLIEHQTSVHGVKGSAADMTEQVIEIHHPGNVFTIQTLEGNVISEENISQIQTVDGDTIHSIDGATIQTLGRDTIVQTVNDVGTVQTLDGVSGQVMEIPAKTEGGVTQQIIEIPANTVGGSSERVMEISANTVDGVTEQIVEIPANTEGGSTVAIHVQDGALEADDSVQFCIVATPEMLQAFGLQDR